MPTIFSFYITNDFFLPLFLSQGTLLHDCKHSLKRIYNIKQTFMCFGDEYCDSGAMAADFKYMYLDTRQKKAVILSKMAKQFLTPIIKV